MNHLQVLLVAVLCALVLVSGLAIYFYLRSRRAPRPGVTQTPVYAAESSALYETAAIDQFLYDRCCRYMMEHKPFLVDSFTLQDLANAVFTNKAYLSKTINRFSGRNFRQYVNYYRVMYAMELFRGNMSLRVSEMASLSGFHSETSFLQSFKKVMGESPSQWCARMRHKYNH